MRLKTYFATGVDAAMNLARQELGPDAMLVHSKRTSGEAQALGNYEVVFALADVAAPAEERLAPAAPLVSSAPRQTGSSQTGSSQTGSSQTGSSQSGSSEESPAELAELRRMMEQTLRLVRRSETMLRSKDSLEGERADLDAALEDAGFSAEFRWRAQRETPASSASIRVRARLWLDRQLRVAPQLGRTGYARKTVALVGPPGAGKTTTLIKLAARFGVAGRRPAQILSMDSERVGASEALRMNAGVLGIGFQLLDTTHALSQALAEHAHKDLILIDTPGYPSRSMTEANLLSAFLVSRKEVDTHLVLPADLPLAGLQAHLGNYSLFEPAKIVFTRIDEMRCAGPMIEAAICGRTPISFVASGQGIPEDLAEAEKGTLLDSILPNWLGVEVDPAYSRGAAA